MTKFKDLKLNDKIQKALIDKGYTEPTPIQAQSIPDLLNKRDLLGIAQTGTGKTAAFSLPLLHNLYESQTKTNRNNCRALILTPTRELASQIEANILGYSKYLNFTTKVIFGGVSERPQITALNSGIDIVVATPGRLLDLIGQRKIKFDQLETFILDEADRMLDMGFLNDVKKIVKMIPKKRHTLLFSATIPSEIKKLAMDLLNNPKKVEITPESTTVEKIEQSLLFVEKSDKRRLLESVLEDKEIKKVLVFSRTKHGADRIVKNLTQAKVASVAIHGNKSQNARERALSDFTSGKARVLVATDIAARGIDIKDVSHIINFNLPEDSESYVHRIGRTARAGKSGVAISFCDGTELKLLKGIEKTIGMEIPKNSDHPFHTDRKSLSPAAPKAPRGPSNRGRKNTGAESKKTDRKKQQRRGRN
jgi:ATP-dependent RNA helicase RhlE